jgi:hypothetical protein
MHFWVVPAALVANPPGLNNIPLELVFVDGLTSTPPTPPTPRLPCEIEELPPPVHKGVEGMDKIDAPCVAATCWRVNTREMGIEGRELTVEGACKRVKDKILLLWALLPTLRRWSKSAAAAAGEAA